MSKNLRYRKGKVIIFTSITRDSNANEESKVYGAHKAKDIPQ